MEEATEATPELNSEMRTELEGYSNKNIDQSDSNNSDNVLEALSLTSSPSDSNYIEEQTEGNIDKPSIEVQLEDSFSTVESKKPPNNEGNKELTPRKRKLTDSTADEDEISEGNDMEFCWEDYLFVTSTIAAPPTAFAHVEHSLENILKVGMKLEIPNVDVPGTYWIASVVVSCGPLLSLRYFGDDHSKAFWHCVRKNEVYPPGWCAKNNKELSPPPSVREKCPNWRELVEKETNEYNVPENLMELLRNGATPVEKIKQKMKVEVQEELNPTKLWIAMIIENVGGRLLMRYEGVTSHNFWLFYLSPRIHPLGWGKCQGYQYCPPDEFKALHTDEEWSAVFKDSMEDNNMPEFPKEILEPQEDIEPHNFKVGMKIEALNPYAKSQICPATVTKILNNYYFLVEIDDYRKETDKKHSPAVICCHSKSLNIFYVYWAKEHGVKTHFPKGLVDNPGNKDFDWKEYLNFTRAEPAPRELFLGNCTNMGLESGMKLEAVNPNQSNQVTYGDCKLFDISTGSKSFEENNTYQCIEMNISAATVTRVVDQLIWIQLDSIDGFHSHYILPANSQEIFPVGWCESNGFPLKPPRACLSKRQRKIMKKIVIGTADTSPRKLAADVITSSNNKKDKASCPKLYFNHKCFSGPYLSKSRLAELPKHVGPGPVDLVLKEVLSMLINIAYKSSRVLALLQLKGKPGGGMREQILKAKYKGRTHRAAVELVCKTDQVAEFCRKICLKLECCPYLFSPIFVSEECPEKCYTRTKTQYIFQTMCNLNTSNITVQNFAKKRGPGRPPLIPRNEDGTRGPGRRRKRRWHLLPVNKSSSGNHSETNKSSCSENTEKENCKEDKSTASVSSGEQALKLKRKYKKFVAPKSAIVTRGAKLPNFGLNWRRRQDSFTHYTRYASQFQSNTAKTSSSVVKPQETKPIQPSVKQPEIASNKMSGPPPLKMGSNPLTWNIDDVVRFIKTTDCAPLARILKEQEVDGQAFLLLNLSVVQEFLRLKPGPAMKLCRHIERVKLGFYTCFA